MTEEKLIFHECRAAGLVFNTVSDWTDWLKENKYDIVFMDHFMPGMDGIETLQEMKKQMMPNISGTPFIAMTSNTATGAREMYIKNGFSDYMVKPIEGRALEAICIKWLPVDKVYAGHNAVDKGVKKD